MEKHNFLLLLVVVEIDKKNGLQTFIYWFEYVLFFFATKLN